MPIRPHNSIVSMTSGGSGSDGNNDCTDRRRISTTTATTEHLVDCQHSHERNNESDANASVVAPCVPTQPIGSATNESESESTNGGGVDVDGSHEHDRFTNTLHSVGGEQNCGGQLEVIDVDDDVASPPMPMAHIAAVLERQHDTKGTGSKLEAMCEDVDNNINPPIPIEQLVATTVNRDGKLEVTGDDGKGDGSIRAPIPIEHQQQFEPAKYKRRGKLEVIGDGNDADESISAPIPIEQQFAPVQTKSGDKLEVNGDNGEAENSSSEEIDMTRIVVPLRSTDAVTVDDSDEERRTDSIVYPPPASVPIISMPPNDVDDIEQPEVAVSEPTYADPPFPLLEATLVDDVVYDAVAVHPSWWKRHPKIAFGGLVVIISAIVAAVAVPSIRLSGRNNREQNSLDKQDTTNSLPVKRGLCFTDKRELQAALENYTEQFCSNDQSCEVAQKYGWPMNYWCVSNIRDMSGLFSGTRTVYEEISDWDVSSVTNMNSMFADAATFNGNLSTWNVSSVTDMSSMFSGASAFNGNLSTWMSAPSLSWEPCSSTQMCLMVTFQVGMSAPSLT